MKKAVSENINDFLHEQEYEFDAELSDVEPIEDVDFSEEEDGEEYIEIESTMDKMRKVFGNELKTPEYSRLSYLLKLKDGSKIEGVPMAELPSGDAFLFKINGQIKKIKLENIYNFSAIDLEEEIVNEDFSGGPFEELKAAMQDLAGAYQAELVIEDNEIGFEIDGIYISVQYEPGDEDPYLVICKDPEVGVDQSFRSIQEAMDYIETLADTFFNVEEEEEEDEE
jgi:hypothetical protein